MEGSDWQQKYLMNQSGERESVLKHRDEQIRCFSAETSDSRSAARRGEYKRNDSHRSMNPYYEASSSTSRTHEIMRSSERSCPPKYSTPPSNERGQFDPLPIFASTGQHSQPYDSHRRREAPSRGTPESKEYERSCRNYSSSIAEPYRNQMDSYHSNPRAYRPREYDVAAASTYQGIPDPPLRESTDARVKPSPRPQQGPPVAARMPRLPSERFTYHRESSLRRLMRRQASNNSLGSGSNHSSDNYPLSSGVSSSSVNSPAGVPLRRGKLIEVMPGYQVPLRGANETWQSVENDFFLPTKCMGCEADICCIQDAKYVICPSCKVVSPMEGDERSFGAGLGFTFDELARWQGEIMRNRSRPH